MILGLGVDLVEIARIRRAMENPRFAERILTADELAQMHNSPDPESYLASRWAAKEAIKKAFPVLDSWQQAQVLQVAGSAPEVWVEGLPQGEAMLVSLSHEQNHCVAVAIRQR